MTPDASQEHASPRRTTTADDLARHAIMSQRHNTNARHRSPWLILILAVCSFCAPLTGTAQTGQLPGEWRGSYTCSPKPESDDAGGEGFLLDLRLQLKAGQLSGEIDNSRVKERFSGRVSQDGSLLITSDAQAKGDASRRWKMQADGVASAGFLLAVGEYVEASSDGRSLDCVLMLTSNAARPGVSQLEQSLPPLTGTWTGAYSCADTPGAARNFPAAAVQVTLKAWNRRLIGSIDTKTFAEDFVGVVGPDGRVVIRSEGYLLDSSQTWRLTAGGQVAGDSLQASGGRRSAETEGAQPRQVCDLKLLRAKP